MRVCAHLHHNVTPQRNMLRYVMGTPPYWGYPRTRGVGVSPLTHGVKGLPPPSRSAPERGSKRGPFRGPQTLPRPPKCALLKHEDMESYVKNTHLGCVPVCSGVPRPTPRTPIWTPGGVPGGYPLGPPFGGSWGGDDTLRHTLHHVLRVCAHNVT